MSNRQRGIARSRRWPTMSDNPAGGRRWKEGLLATALAALAGCNGGGAGAPADESTRQGSSTAEQVTALTSGPTPVAVPSSAAILGFEATTGWQATVPESASPVRTQGAAALALSTPAADFGLVSDPVSSTAPALAGLADPSSSFALDVMLPREVTANRYAWIELSVSAPSLKLTATLPRVDLKALTPGQYATVTFAVTDSVRKALAGQKYDDLSFHLALHMEDPDADLADAAYRFDNLRVHSPSTPPPGGARSVDLDAQLSYSPTKSIPALASFPVGLIQVPQSFHVKAGAAGNGTVTLSLGFSGTPNFTCTYAADAGGASYSLKSCDTPVKAGDLVGADWAQLTVVGGNATAGTTKIRAQLAKNPAGDLAGSGLIPPMPTFWGDTTSNVSQTLTDYFNAVKAAPPTNKKLVRTPVPDFAQRLRTTAPYDVPGRPPAPNDPPFDKSQHLNEGGAWDAYWELKGDLNSSNTGNQSTTHLDATLGVHAVLLGNDVDVASLVTTVDTNSGTLDPNGFHSPSASGTVDVYLFGNNVAHEDATPSTGFTFNRSTSKSVNLPPINFWVFSLTLGAEASAGITTTGTLSFDGFAVNATPNANVSATIQGGVNVGVASGGVTAKVQLIQVATPLNASINWVFNTAPGACDASLTFNLDGQATVSSLGGEVDLTATIGVCPAACWTPSTTLFSWKPLASATATLFSYTTSDQIATFPSSVCIEPLTVTIQAPPPPVYAGVPTTIIGGATRPIIGSLPAPVDCSALSWTSSDPADLIAYPTDRCHPSFTFDSSNLSPRTIVATALDQFGETGTSSLTVDVAPVGGPVAQIISPSPLSRNDFGWPVKNLPLSGDCANDPSATLTWSYLAQGSTGAPVTIGTGANVTWTPPFQGTYTLFLVASDAGGTSTPATSVVDFIFTQ
jgi:hypothetical protein